MSEVWVWEFDDGDYYSSGALRQFPFYYGSADAARQAAEEWVAASQWVHAFDGGVHWSWVGNAELWAWASEEEGRTYDPRLVVSRLVPA